MTGTPFAEDAPPHWAAALARVRDEVNPAVGAAVASGVPLASVTAALRRVGPAFERHCASMPLAAQDRWASALARAVMRALDARQWSDRTVVPWTVTELLPRLAARVPDLDDPPRKDLVAELIHAAGEVWRHGDVALWGRLLLAVAHTSTDGGPVTLTANEIRDVGVVAAWRAGHVRARAAAHRIGPGLPDALLARALDVAPGGIALEVLAANALEPASWLPDERSEVFTGRVTDPPVDAALRTIGGFTGFGGPFHHPPVVVSGDGLHWRLREQDGPGAPQPEWDLMVDVHGAWLGPAGSSCPEASTSWVSALGRSASGRTVLVTSPRSHVIVHARAAA